MFNSLKIENYIIMRKVFLLTAVAGLVSFTSCKNEKTDRVEDDVIIVEGEESDLNDTSQDLATGFDEAYETAKAAITDAPQIENPELQELVNQLHDEAVKAKASATIGNPDELHEATTSITSLSESLQNFSSDPEFEKAKSYYEEIKVELEQL